MRGRSSTRSEGERRAVRKSRASYVAGMLLGLAAAVMLVPEVRRTGLALASIAAERARKAWEEGRRAMRRREQQLEDEVFGPGEEDVAPGETPDYIV